MPGNSQSSRRQLIKAPPRSNNPFVFSPIRACWTKFANWPNRLIDILYKRLTVTKKSRIWGLPPKNLPCLFERGQIKAPSEAISVSKIAERPLRTRSSLLPEIIHVEVPFSTASPSAHKSKCTGFAMTNLPKRSSHAALSRRTNQKQLTDSVTSVMRTPAPRIIWLMSFLIH